MIISQLSRNLKSIDIEKVAIDSVKATKEDILAKNKLQLLDGKTKLGNNIFPTYLEDPFFKTLAAAQRYSDWKDRITPNPKRTPGVPNLFINGALVHDKLSIEVSGNEIITDLQGPGVDILNKYPDVIGLDSDYKQEYIDENLRPEFTKEMKAAIFKQ